MRDTLHGITDHWFKLMNINCIFLDMTIFLIQYTAFGMNEIQLLLQHVYHPINRWVSWHSPRLWTSISNDPGLPQDILYWYTL